jgi:hypothetical protein
MIGPGLALPRWRRRRWRSRRSSRHFAGPSRLRPADGHGLCASAMACAVMAYDARCIEAACAGRRWDNGEVPMHGGLRVTGGRVESARGREPHPPQPLHPPIPHPAPLRVPARVGRRELLERRAGCGWGRTESLWLDGFVTNESLFVTRTKINNARSDVKPVY